MTTPPVILSLDQRARSACVLFFKKNVFFFCFVLTGRLVEGIQAKRKAEIQLELASAPHLWTFQFPFVLLATLESRCRIKYTPHPQWITGAPFKSAPTLLLPQAVWQSKLSKVISLSLLWGSVPINSAVHVFPRGLKLREPAWNGFSQQP